MPARAKMTVKAIGRKSFPSMPSRVRIGKYTIMMMSSPNIVGFRTSTAASRMMASFVAIRAVMGEASDAILDHHHGAIDHQPEIDGTQAHQASGDADPLHHGDGEEHGKRDGRSDDQPGPEVSEERKQHGDDKDRPFKKVPLDGLEHRVNEVGPLVDHADRDARRERFLRRRPSPGPGHW